MARRPRGNGWGVQAWATYDTVYVASTRAGSWSKSGSVVTLTTPSAHSIKAGMGIHVILSGTGAPPTGFYTVTGTPNALSMTITVPSGTGVSGSFAVQLVLFDSFNINSAVRADVGTAILTFDKPFINGYYSIVATSVSRNYPATPEAHVCPMITAPPLPTLCIVKNVTSSNFAADTVYTSVHCSGRQ